MHEYRSCYYHQHAFVIQRSFAVSSIKQPSVCAVVRMEIVFQCLTMVTGSEFNWRGQVLVISADFAGLFFLLMIYPPLPVFTRLCRPPSPPPRERISQIETRFNKDFS